LLANRRLFNTVSFKLALLCALQFLIVLCVLMTINYVVTQRALEEQLQSRVHDDFLDVTQLAKEQDQDSINREISERISEPFFNGVYFFASDSTGQKVAGNLDEVERKNGWQTLSLDADPSAPSEAVPIRGEGQIFPDQSFVFVGKDARQLIMTERTLIFSYLGSALIAGFLALTAGFLLSRGLVRKIDDISTTSQAIIDGNLTKRIPVNGTNDEIDRLSVNLNRLFQNNQKLLDSLKQVTVAIAHDLRTPLTRVRNTLEKLRHQPRLSHTHKSQLDAALSESEQLLQTFGALMRIAQIEAGTRRQGFTRFNLSNMGLRIFAIYQAVAEDAGKILEAEITPEVFCEGDPDLLLQLCVNLVENAIKHTPSGTTIRLKVVAPCQLEVSDDGPGIPDTELGRVTERFYRLDRSRSAPGNGLGLALVAAIAQIHEADFRLSDNEPGLRARLIFSQSAGSMSG